MRRDFALACLVFTVMVLPLRADEPVAAKRAEAFRKRLAESVRSAGAAPRRAGDKASAEQIKAAQERIKALEAKDPQSLTAEEHTELTGLYQQLDQQDEAIQHAQRALELSPEHDGAYASLIKALLSAGKVAVAEETYQQAINKFPQSKKLLGLNQVLFQNQLAAGQPMLAAAHMIAVVEFQRQELLAGEKKEGADVAFLRIVNQLVSTLQQGEASTEALGEIEGRMAEMQSQLANPAAAGFRLARSNVQVQRIRQKANAEKAGEALAELDRSIETAKAEYDARPSDPGNWLALLPLISFREQLAREVTPGVPADYDPLVELLAAGIKQNADSPLVLEQITSNYTALANSLAKAGKSDTARDLLTKFGQQLKELGSSDLALVKTIEACSKRIAGQLRQMAAEARRQELIGQAHVPLEAEAWVNGSPLSVEEMQGKVVLLDFFAVWCGPCIATFPHLRDWHDRFADRGLEIVGLTRYYGYGWDAEGGRGKQVEGITPEEERQALSQFAEHHKLKHRLAEMPTGSQLSEKYGVTGIPQVVVIDRQGIVRLIRVGSGEPNARDIEAMIEQLLAEPAANK